MKSTIISATLVLMSLVSIDAVCQDASPVSSSSSKSDVGAVLTPIKKDQRAPYSGVLASPAAVASIVAQIKTAPDSTKIEVDRATSTCVARCDKKLSDFEAETTSQKKVYDAKIKTLQDDNERVSRALLSYEKDSLSKWSPGTWMSIGAVGGVVATIGTIVIVGITTK